MAGNQKPGARSRNAVTPGPIISGHTQHTPSAAKLEVGAVIWRGESPYRIVDKEWVVTRAGRDVEISHILGLCADCGDAFEFTAGETQLKLNNQIRRCRPHRDSGRRAKKRLWFNVRQVSDIADVPIDTVIRASILGDLRTTKKRGIAKGLVSRKELTRWIRNPRKPRQ